MRLEAQTGIMWQTGRVIRELPMKTPQFLVFKIKLGCGLGLKYSLCGFQRGSLVSTPRLGRVSIREYIQPQPMLCQYFFEGKYGHYQMGLSGEFSLRIPSIVFESRWLYWICSITIKSTKRGYNRSFSMPQLRLVALVTCKIINQLYPNQTWESWNYAASRWGMKRGLGDWWSTNYKDIFLWYRCIQVE